MVDEADFEELNQYVWFRHGKGDYACRAICENYKKTHLPMHTHLLGPAPHDFVTDHKNTDRFDNRRKNLRFANWTVSNLNKNTNHGVRWRADKKKWIIDTTVAGKKFFGGYFDTELEARRVGALIHASLVYYELTKGG